MRVSIQTENEEELQNLLGFVTKSGAKLEIVLPQKKKVVRRKVVRKKRSHEKTKNGILQGDDEKSPLGQMVV